MGNWRRWALLLSIVGAVAILGCAGASTHQLADDQEASTRGSWSEDDANDNGMHNHPARSASASGSASALDRAKSRVSSVGRSVSGAFKRTTDQVSNALEIKPKVVPAADSVKLSNMPGQLSPVLYVRGAAFSEAKGNMEGAQQQYEKALALDPNDITTLIAYARFRDRMSDSNQALEIYQRARSIEPSNATVWNDLALCHARRGEVEPALGAMQRAIALRPDNARYRNNLAAVLVQADRPDDAVRELQQVHSPAAANHNVACLLLRLHNQALAIDYLRRAVSLDPSLQRARVMLSRLDQAGTKTPREQTDNGGIDIVMPPERTTEPQFTDVPSNSRNLRTGPWGSARPDVSYGSHHQSGVTTVQRFPVVEP